MKRFAVLAALAVVALPGVAALPVVPAENQRAMLESDDPQLSANKKIAYDFFRIVLQGLRLERAADFMHEDYMQHNPNADTGLKGFLEYFERVVEQRGKPAQVPQELNGLVAIQAEGDYVTLSFVREYDDPRSPGNTYTTTWFDMFRIVDGKIAEHWDSALVQVPGQ
jgi:predicted SnoaL-like aldol condensation-catalyzing enzyme